MYESRDDGLYEIRHDSDPIKLCGPIQVKAIVSDKARRNGFGLLLEWKNLVGNTFQEVLPMEEIDDYSAKKLRQRLRRSGFVISPRRNSWDKVLCYLLETKVEEHAISSHTTGWVDNSFVTPGWTVNNGDEKVIFAGSTNTEHLAIRGSLESWKDQVGTLCQDNPVAYILYLHSSRSTIDPLVILGQLRFSSRWPIQVWKNNGNASGC